MIIIEKEDLNNTSIIIIDKQQGTVKKIIDYENNSKELFDRGNVLVKSS